MRLCLLLCLALGVACQQPDPVGKKDPSAMRAGSSRLSIKGKPSTPPAEVSNTMDALEVLPAPPRPDDVRDADLANERLEPSPKAKSYYIFGEGAHTLPAGAPSAALHVPKGFTVGETVEVVVFLHGWNGCVRVLMEPGQTRCRGEKSRRFTGWGLSKAHDRAKQNTVLFIPQLAYREREGEPGRIRHKSFFVDLFKRATSEVPELANAPLDSVKLTLVAHSAGYESALALLNSKPFPIDKVVLMDSLYAGRALFGDWLLASPDKRLVSLFTKGTTARENKKLSSRLVATTENGHAVGVVAPATLRRGLRKHRAVFLSSEVRHGKVPERYLAEVVRELHRN